jgi:isoleucyl-tRNA synthetase
LQELNTQVSWHPPSAGSGRFGSWLKGNVDWALSRERFWGTPLPLWVCDDGHVRCVGSRAELAQLTGAQPDDLHRPAVDALQFPCPQCAKTMCRTPEVLDGWWDSGAMPFAQHGAPLANAEQFASQFPAAFACEGLEQTRGWFYALLAVSTLVFDAAPYENVLASAWSPTPTPTPTPRRCQRRSATPSTRGRCLTATGRTPAAGAT